MNQQPSYSKTWLSYADQVHKLIERGLVIAVAERRLAILFFTRAIAAFRIL
jgi:abortive infection bacteriophage resistance protein